MQLDVPHIHQSGPTHCGVACLEMVYKYFEITDISQESIWVSKRSHRPNSQDYFMLTSSMIQDLVDRGLNVISGQITLESKLCLGSIQRLIRAGTPIIACKQWPGNPILGHFVVIIGVEKNEVIYLDPERTPTPIKENIDDFVDKWKSVNPSDPNREVVGGQFIIMGNHDKPIKGKKMRMNTVTSDSTGHMINDEKYMYIWDDKNKQGSKIAIPTKEEAKQMEQDAQKYQDQIPQSPKLESEADFKDLEGDGYTVSCKAGSVDDSTFVPPTDIKFIDPTEMRIGKSKI